MYSADSIRREGYEVITFSGSRSFLLPNIRCSLRVSGQRFYRFADCSAVPLAISAFCRLYVPGNPARFGGGCDVRDLKTQAPEDDDVDGGGISRGDIIL